MVDVDGEGQIKTLVTQTKAENLYFPMEEKSTLMDKRKAAFRGIRLRDRTPVFLLDKALAQQHQLSYRSRL